MSEPDVPTSLRPPMELHQLRYFVEVARQQNFTRAAQRLHVAQPALSQQIRKLEDELGTPLFVRGPRETTLTPAGEALFPRVQGILAQLESAREAVAGTAGRIRQRLVIATIPTLSACWLPAPLREVREAHPGLDLVLCEDSSVGVASRVQSGEAQLGLLQLPANEELFAVEELLTEAFVVVMPATHPLAARRSLHLAELAAEPFVLFKGRVRAVVLEACRAAGFEPRLAAEQVELETVRALVQAGVGLTLLPSLTASLLPGGTQARPLRTPRLHRRLGLIARRDHVWSAAEQELAAALRGAVAAPVR